MIAISIEREGKGREGGWELRELFVLFRCGFEFRGSRGGHSQNIFVGGFPEIQEK